MNKDLIEPEVGEITDSINMQQLLDSAINIFSKQALCSIDDSDLTNVALVKEKAENFKCAVNNIIQLSTQLDSLVAHKNRFRHSDELRILNNLRNQCETQAKMNSVVTDFVHKELTNLIETCQSPRELEQYQSMLDANIRRSKDIISAIDTLIKLERLSGNRHVGSHSQNTMPVSQLRVLQQDLEEANSLGYNPNKPIRVLEQD